MASLTKVSSLIGYSNTGSLGSQIPNQIAGSPGGIYQYSCKYNCAKSLQRAALKFSVLGTPVANLIIATVLNAGLGTAMLPETR